uniref:Uncharacterized protein n=1 Tax=Fagus sylvatica TaxID=28930 RepID=A0A2N9HU35_FAGSY
MPHKEITRESPALRQPATLSHESPFRILSDLLQPLECPFGPRKNWHTNRDELRDNRNVCTRIHSDPQQLGLRAKTLKQEGRFSYNVQLPDRQELLRSSRNLNRKMTPWHKELSNDLCSQDHILRTQARLCARPVLLESRVFLTHNELIRKPGYVGKRTHSCTVWNSRITKIFPGLAGIFAGKMLSNRPKTLRRPLFAEPYLSSPSSVSRKSRTLKKRLVQAFRRYQDRQNPTSGARSNTRANTDKKQGKMSRRFDAFFSRTAAFACRVFLTRCKLTSGPGCVGKMMTPATTCNSWFAGGIPRLTGIFAGKTHKNSSGTPTSGSHNSPVRTPIRANFIPLESRRREISDDMLHDIF